MVSNIGKREAVLGTPFLRLHNPDIDWKKSEIRIQPKEANAVDLEGLPSEYHKYADVFGEGFFTELPPHRPYDLSIDLKEGATPTFGPIYATTRNETIELKAHIKENLAKGTLCHSKSPAASPVMFVPKKDGGLRMCVDYRKLNAITVKNRYPLPLQSELFKKLREATIFTKFDLRSGYHNVRIKEGDKWKTAFRTKEGLFKWLVMPFGLNQRTCRIPTLHEQHLQGYSGYLRHSISG